MEVITGLYALRVPFSICCEVRARAYEPQKTLRLATYHPLAGDLRPESSSKAIDSSSHDKFR